MDNEFHKFRQEQMKKNSNLKQWEIKDMWLDKQWNNNIDKVPVKPEENEEQINPVTQNSDLANGVKPVTNDHEEEETNPQIKNLQQQVKQIATQNPSLGIRLDSVGQKQGTGDSRMWYLFSNKTEQTPTGPAAKKWGGYSSNEIKNMADELKKLGSNGLNSYFTAPNNQK